MFVDPAILKNVFFILRDHETDEGVTVKRPVGTGFLVRVFKDQNIGMLYFVTAQHVIRNNFGANPSTVRFNQPDGVADIDLAYDDWFMSETADVAVFPVCADGRIPIRKVFQDVRVIDETFFIGDNGHFVWGNQIVAQKLRPSQTAVSVSVGDDLISPGLFTLHHSSRGKNVPVARYGRISLMPTPMRIERFRGDEYEESERPESVAYLAEFHSRGGISGSPVFWYREAVVPQGFEMGPMHNNATLQTRSFGALLGMVHGHFDHMSEARVHPPGKSKSEYIGWTNLQTNTGMAIVTPAPQIHALLHRADVKEHRDKHSLSFTEPAPTPDVSEAGENQ